MTYRSGSLFGSCLAWLVVSFFLLLFHSQRPPKNDKEAIRYLGSLWKWEKDGKRRGEGRKIWTQRFAAYLLSFSSPFPSISSLASLPPYSPSALSISRPSVKRLRAIYREREPRENMGDDMEGTARTYQRLQTISSSIIFRKLFVIAGKS